MNPIETRKKLHEHGEAAHRQAEIGHGGSESSPFPSRICEAVLLALVTITQPGRMLAKWSTASRVDTARASTLGNLATRDLTAIVAPRFRRLELFNAWFIAFSP